MHPRLSQVYIKWAVAAGMIILVPTSGSARADDPGFFGRLFRLGGASPSATTSSSSGPAGSLPYSRGSAGNPSYGPAQAADPFPPSMSSSSAFDSMPPAAPPATATAPPTPSAGPGPRLAPHPRVSSAVTTADPLLTRFALGRSNDGSQFGMFLQIFTDGTVVDSEGVHRIKAADLRPILESVQSGELYRLKGHCGAPPTDFIEYVHIVVYDHRFGRLTAHSFSYSGNPQGCDHAIKHIHTALENLQAKLSRPATASGATVSAPRGLAGGLETQPIPHANPSAAGAGAAAPAGPVIPLTAIDSPR